MSSMFSCFERRVELDGAVFDPVAVEHRQNALAHRGDVRELLDIAVLIDDASAIHDDEARGVRVVANEVVVFCSASGDQPYADRSPRPTYAQVLPGKTRSAGICAVRGARHATTSKTNRRRTCGRAHANSVHERLQAWRWLRGLFGQLQGLSRNAAVVASRL